MHKPNRANVAFVLQWTARGKRSGISIGGRFLVVMTFPEGKLVTIAHFGFSEEHYEQ